MIVQQFLGWFHTAPVNARADAASALTRAYLYSEMSVEDREAAEAAMTLLLDDVSSVVRRSMAEALAASPAAPRHIVLALADDQADVADPVLRHSPVLLDAELVDRAATGDPRIQSAIAARYELSSSVAAAIAEVGCGAACLALLRNQAAHIVKFSLHRLAERHGTDPDIRDEMLQRHDLPLEIRQLLVSKLSDALCGMPVVKAWLDADRARSLARDACDKATVTLAYNAEDDELPALIQHLRISEQLTPSLLLRSVCVGDIRLLAAVLSELTKIPFMRVVSILAEGRRASVSAIYERSGLPRDAFPAFDTALSVWRETIAESDDTDRYQFARRMIERVLTRYEDFAEGDMDQLMTLLRRFAADAARDAAQDYAAPYIARPDMVEAA